MTWLNRIGLDRKMCMCNPNRYIITFCIKFEFWLRLKIGTFISISILILIFRHNYYFRIFSNIGFNVRALDAKTNIKCSVDKQWRMFFILCCLQHTIHTNSNWCKYRTEARTTRNELIAFGFRFHVNCESIFQKKEKKKEQETHAFITTN